MQVLSRTLVCAGLCAILMGCADPATPPPALEYDVGGCAEESETTRGGMTGEVEISSSADVIHLDQELTYVCCAELVLTLELEGNTLRVIETNVGEICRCVCEYSIEAEVSGLGPGEYDVEVWGVQYGDLHTPELLGKARVTLG